MVYLILLYVISNQYGFVKRRSTETNLTVFDHVMYLDL